MQGSRFLKNEYQKKMPIGGSANQGQPKMLHKRQASQRSKTIYDNPSITKPSFERQSVSVPRQRPDANMEVIQEDYRQQALQGTMTQSNYNLS